MLYHATIEKFVAALRDALPEAELISTSRNGGGNKMLRKMSLGGYVTLGNFSCNLCRKKIARQVGGKIAYLILVSEHHCSAPIILQ